MLLACSQQNACIKDLDKQLFRTAHMLAAPQAHVMLLLLQPGPSPLLPTSWSSMSSTSCMALPARASRVASGTAGPCLTLSLLLLPPLVVPVVAALVLTASGSFGTPSPCTLLPVQPSLLLLPLLLLGAGSASTGRPPPAMEVRSTASRWERRG
jgi:hypothetical protein